MQRLPSILIKLLPRRRPLTPVGRMGKLIDPKLGPVQCTGVRDSIRVNSICFDSIRFDSIRFDSWIAWLTIGNNWLVPSSTWRMSCCNKYAGRLRHELAKYYDNDIILYFVLSEIKCVERNPNSARHPNRCSSIFVLCSLLLLSFPFFSFLFFSSSSSSSSST